MAVLYNNKKIEPGPFVEIARKVERSPDGLSRSKVYNITVTGTLSIHKGSPDYTGTFWTGSGSPPDTPVINLDPDNRLAIARDKIGALTNLFEDEGHFFEIVPDNGSQSIKFIPRLVDIKFAEGSWYERVNYVIQLETDCILFGSLEVCANDRGDFTPEESWAIEQADELGRTYRLSHNVSANAKRRYADNGTVEYEGWEIARQMVLGSDSGVGTDPTLLGFESDKLIASGVLNLTDFAPYNHVRSQQIDEGQGRFSVTETWLCFDNNDNFGISTGHAIEDLQIEIRTSSETGITAVSMNGTITGLLERNSDFEITKSRYDNAAERWGALTASDATLLTRAQAYVDGALNPLPLIRTHTKNIKSGIITYQWEYDDRAGFSGDYLSELVTISIKQPADVFAQIGVIGRLQGPILQAIGSKTARSITVSAEIKLPGTKYGESEPTPPVYNTLAKALTYTGTPFQIFVQDDTETWVPRLGSYNRSSTFVYEV